MSISIKFLFVLLFSFLAIHFYGQTQKTDSLFNVLKSSKNDSVKVFTCSELCWEYQFYNPDSAIYFGNIGIKLASKINYRSGLANCYNNLGVIYMNQGNYDLAIDYYSKNLKICQEIGDTSGVSRGYNNVGIVEMYQGNYDKALECYLKALKVIEKTDDNIAIANSYGNIGIVNHYQANYDKAIEYYLRSLKLLEELNNKSAMAYCYNNIGALYSDQQNYPKSLDYFFKAVKANEELGNKNGLSGCYGNIGNIYTYQGAYNIAIDYYMKSMKISEELDDQNGLALVYVLIATVNVSLSDSAALSENQKKNYLNKAIDWGTKAFELAKKIEVIPIQKDAAEILISAYKKLGNYKKSLEFAEIFISAKDSLFSEEKTKALTEMGAKYESEKKQLQIDNLNKENALKKAELAQSEEKRNKQRILIYSFILGFLIILVFSFLLYRMFLQKKKANVMLAQKNIEVEQKNEEITSQRDEIEAQRNEVQKHRDLVVHQKEEIESSITYAKRIQNAVLPTVEHLNMFLSDYFILFRPKDIVSGDFYWATIIKNWQILTVADCTGHGVPGAFMSMLGVSFLNEIVRKKEVTQACDVLNNLRKSIIESLSQTGESGTQKDGMDMSFAVINIETNQLQWAGANNPLWVVRCSKNLSGFENLSGLEDEDCQVITPDRGSVGLGEDASANYEQQTTNNELFEFKPDKMPIAIYERMDDFTNHEIQLNSGDTIYLMSDGYEDQFGGPKGKKFLSKNLKELIVANCLLTMVEQKQILEKTLENWIGEGEQIDDITVLGVRI